MPPEAMIEREPVTVICSEMGWVRAMKGHIAEGTELKFKDGDKARFQIAAETTDKIIVLGSNGRFYTVLAANLPGGRGMGEPLRLMVDLPNEARIVTMFVHKPGRKLIVASSAGDGFVVPEDEVVAQTRAGKQVLNVAEGIVAAVCKPVEGDHVVVVGDNRKMLVFPLTDLPEMGRGKGVAAEVQGWRSVRPDDRDLCGGAGVEGTGRTDTDRAGPVGMVGRPGDGGADGAARISARQPVQLTAGRAAARHLTLAERARYIAAHAEPARSSPRPCPARPHHGRAPPRPAHHRDGVTGLPQGFGRQRTHPDPAAGGRVRDLARISGRRCGDREHLRVPGHGQGRVTGGHWRGAARERAGDRHRLSGGRA